MQVDGCTLIAYPEMHLGQQQTLTPPAQLQRYGLESHNEQDVLGCGCMLTSVVQYLEHLCAASQVAWICLKCRSACNHQLTAGTMPSTA